MSTRTLIHACQQFRKSLSKRNTSRTYTHALYPLTLLCLLMSCALTRTDFETCLRIGCVPLRPVQCILSICAKKHFAWFFGALHTGMQFIAYCMQKLLYVCAMCYVHGWLQICLMCAIDSSSMFFEYLYIPFIYILNYS